MIRCRFGGPAPCMDDLCHGAVGGGGTTICGLDMSFEQEIEDELNGRDDDDPDEEYDDYDSWLEAQCARLAFSRADAGAEAASRGGHHDRRAALHFGQAVATVAGVE